MLIFPAVNVLLFVPLKLDSLVVPFVFIVNDTVPLLLLTSELKSNVFPANTVPFATVIVASAFTAFTVTPVAVAAFTVSLPALEAFIVAVPLPATAFIVVPSTVNISVLLELNVTFPGVPPLPSLVDAAVIVPLYFTS